MIKDFSLSVAGVLALALGMALAFHWTYPDVDIGTNLAGLFVFVALVMRLAIGKLWAATHKPRPLPSAETAK
jgi:hypothetical protein